VGIKNDSFLVINAFGLECIVSELFLQFVLYSNNMAPL